MMFALVLYDVFICARRIYWNNLYLVPRIITRT